MAADPIAIEDVDDSTAIVTVLDDPLGDSSAQLADRVGGLLTEGTLRVVVEFGGGIVNSKLLDALVRASRRGGPQGGIAVVAPPGYVRQMLLVSELGGVLLLADTREEAIEALGGPPAV